MEITNDNTATWGALTDKTKLVGAKLRIAQTMKVTKPDGDLEKSFDIMNQIKGLTDADIADFGRWFNEAGYPTTVAPVSA